VWLPRQKYNAPSLICPVEGSFFSTATYIKHFPANIDFVSVYEFPRRILIYSEKKPLIGHGWRQMKNYSGRNAISIFCAEGKKLSFCCYFQPNTHARIAN